MATWEGDYRESFTVTAMVSLTSAQPCWASPPRGGTNDQWDFFRVIVRLLADWALQEGDFLVLDNARVHHAVGATAFLPAYSPELNPCTCVC